MAMHALDPAPALAAFLARLAAARSATDCLEAWCRERGLGAGPMRILRRAPLPDAPDAASLLGSPGAIRHRSVTLMRGDTALSDCDLWWRADRLMPEMAAALEATDLPFGRVVAPLAPLRRLVLQRMASPPHALEVQAVLEAAGRPLAFVREFYRLALFAGPLPPGRD
jgi:hypothetical protein